MAVRYTRPLRPRKGPDDIGAPTKAAVHQRRHWRAAHFDDYGNASIVARPLSSTKPPRFETTIPSTNEAPSSTRVVKGRCRQRGQLR
jgi:hypothetical protein